MKKLKITTLLLVSFVAVFLACRKNELTTFSEEDSSKKVDSRMLNNQPRNSEIQEQLTESLESLSGVDFNSTPRPQTEQQAASIFSTLQANSIEKIKINLSLTDADLIEVFGSLSDPEIAHFGIILTALETVEIPSSDAFNICNQQNVYVKCLVETFLPCDAIKAIKKMMDEGGVGGASAISGGAFYTAWSAFTTVERKVILKGIVQLAGKYGGPLAVVSAAFDFTVCMLNNGSQTGQSSGTLVPISISSNLLPNTIPNHMYWPTAEGVVDPIVDSSQNTSIFFNWGNNKYYVDSIFTTLVPDGYYYSPPVMQYHRVHHIVSGSAIGVYEIVPN